MYTDNPEQDAQDHIERQELIEQEETETVELKTPQEIDEHLAKVMRNRMSRFERFRHDVIEWIDRIVTKIN